MASQLAIFNGSNRIVISKSQMGNFSLLYHSINGVMMHAENFSEFPKGHKRLSLFDIRD